MVMTREQAATAVAAESARRGDIQANLLDLDNSFGKRLLAGASLAGQTKQRWDQATAEMARLWGSFISYSAVIDRAAELLARGRRSSEPELAEITRLLNGLSVQLASAPAPLAQRDLTDIGRSELSLAMAVREMKGAFTRVTEVVAAAESVWNAVSAGLDQISAQLAQARQQAAGLADDALAGRLEAAEAELSGLRDVLNRDPLALWQRGRVDTSRLDRLRQQAEVTAAQAGELARLRDDAQGRVTAAGAAAAAAAAAWQDAVTSRERAAAKIAASALPPPPQAADLAGRLATLEALMAAGRWSRLAAELEIIEEQAARASRQFRDAQRAAEALLSRRGELRALLDAYQVKAARLGAAEDPTLTSRYDLAHDLLWTAPCDLAAAAGAVTHYQEAIVALAGRQR
jgi:chromosome segregation ATPase